MIDKNSKVIIFDMDGVLFDTSAAVNKSFADQYPSLGVETQKELLYGNLYEELEKIRSFKKVETEEEKNLRQKQYQESKSKSPMFTGTRNLLENLHKCGFFVVINTSAKNQNCLPLFENAQILHLIDFIATAEFSKSKVEKFKLIEEKFNLGRKNILFITDTVGDIKEANTSDIPTIAVTWGVHDRTFFGRENHPNLIKIVDTVEELSNFIKQYWK